MGVPREVTLFLFDTVMVDTGSYTFLKNTHETEQDKERALTCCMELSSYRILIGSSVVMNAEEGGKLWRERGCMGALCTFCSIFCQPKTAPKKKKKKMQSTHFYNTNTRSVSRRVFAEGGLLEIPCPWGARTAWPLPCECGRDWELGICYSL